MWVYWLVNFSCLPFPNAKCVTLSWPLPYAISMQISNADWGILVLIIIGREPYRNSCTTKDLAKYLLETGCTLAVVHCRSYRDLALALKQRINTLKKEALLYIWLLLILRAVELMPFMQVNLVLILFYGSPHHLTNLLAPKATVFLRKHLLLLPQFSPGHALPGQFGKWFHSGRKGEEKSPLSLASPHYYPGALPPKFTDKWIMEMLQHRPLLLTWLLVFMWLNISKSSAMVSNVSTQRGQGHIALHHKMPQEGT